MQLREGQSSGDGHDDDALVHAYLSGDLDDAAARRFEERISREPVLRQRLRNLVLIDTLFEIALGPEDEEAAVCERAQRLVREKDRALSDREKVFVDRHTKECDLCRFVGDGGSLRPRLGPRWKRRLRIVAPVLLVATALVLVGTRGRRTSSDLPAVSGGVLPSLSPDAAAALAAARISSASSLAGAQADLARAADDKKFRDLSALIGSESPLKSANVDPIEVSAVLVLAYSDPRADDDYRKALLRFAADTWREASVPLIRGLLARETSEEVLGISYAMLGFKHFLGGEALIGIARESFVAKRFAVAERILSSLFIHRPDSFVPLVDELWAERHSISGSLVRFLLIERTKRLGSDPNLTRELIDLSQHHVDALARVVAFTQLIKQGDLSLLPALSREAEATDPVARYEIAVALGRFGGGNDAATLERLRDDADPAVRRRATEALQAIDEREQGRPKS